MKRKWNKKTGRKKEVDCISSVFSGIGFLCVHYKTPSDTTLSSFPRDRQQTSSESITPVLIVPPSLRHTLEGLNSLILLSDVRVLVHQSSSFISFSFNLSSLSSFTSLIQVSFFVLALLSAVGPSLSGIQQLLLWILSPPLSTFPCQ